MSGGTVEPTSDLSSAIAEAVAVELGHVLARQLATIVDHTLRPADLRARALDALDLLTVAVAGLSGERRGCDACDWDRDPDAAGELGSWAVQVDARIAKRTRR